MKMPLLVFLFLFIHSISFGQRNYNSPNAQHQFFSSADFRVGIPLGQFKDNIDANAEGLGGYTMFRLNNMPFILGVEGSWLTYAREVLRDGPFDWRTNSHIITGHAVIQFDPRVDLPIKPYINGMLGFKNLYTKTRLIDVNAQSNKIAERKSNLNDWAFSFGSATGFYISLGESLPVVIDLRVAYLRGSNARYYARNDDVDIQTVDNPIEVFEVKSGTTHMLILQIGLVLVL